MLSNKKGFTLIELLVVVLIISILAAVAVPQYQKAVDKARVSELFALVKNIQAQQEVFYLGNGHYAADCEELGADLPAGFVERTDNPGSYQLQKGSYVLMLRCLNGGSRFLGSIISDDDALHASIEMIGEHLESTDKNVGSEGRIYCRAANKDARSLNVCRSFAIEEKNVDAYWIK